MNKRYVIINTKANGDFNIDDDKHLIFIEAIKLDENLNKLEHFKAHIKQNSKQVIIDLIKFCENSSIITKDVKDLSFILKALYKHQILNFKFKYIDIKDLVKKDTWNDIKNHYNLKQKNTLNNILKLIKIHLKDNNIHNLKELFLAQPFHGKTFRGLNYAKYICDISTQNNKYYGYIVDYSLDKYISYYSFLKELNHEYFNLDEINKLQAKGAIIIMNVSYLSKESMSFTDCYSIQAVGNNVTSSCNKLINGINNYIKNNKKLKLVLWGSIDNLKQDYEIIDKNILKKLISSIDIIKEPWDYWTKQDLEIIR